MSPLQRLKFLRSRSQKEQKMILDHLVEGCPIRPWPFGMPSSAAPHVVLLGVSPGNRPRPEDRGFNTDGQATEPPTFGKPHGGFFYDDPGRYWQKASDLSRFLVLRDEPSLTGDDAVALSSHLNLGTGQFGQAGEQAIEDNILVWVSRLLNSKFSAKVVVCFGLHRILTNKRYNSLWNRNGGLSIDWTQPSAVQDFDSYRFRLWAIQRADGGRMAVIMWPNHPSRHPFSGGPALTKWQDAKSEVHKLLKMHGF